MMLGDPHFAETLGYMAIYSAPFYLCFYIPLTITLACRPKTTRMIYFLLITNFGYMVFFVLSMLVW